METEDGMHLIIHYSCRLWAWQLVFNNQTLGDNQTNLWSWAGEVPAGRSTAMQKMQGLLPAQWKHSATSVAPGKGPPRLRCPASWTAKAKLCSHCLPKDCKGAVVFGNFILTDSWETIAPFLPFLATSHKSPSYSPNPHSTSRYSQLCFSSDKYWARTIIWTIHNDRRILKDYDREATALSVVIFHLYMIASLR